MRLELEEEGYPPTGGIGGEGVRKALGRPQMEVLTLLAREALQNSWDARLSQQGPIAFMLDAWTFNRSELRAARNQIFADLPEGLPLKKILKGDSIDAVCISDRGTKGLVGPTRADELDLGNPQRNFVAFIRDVGRAASTQIDGGTYGYGKASFYVASKASTICVHTRIKDGKGRLEDRFIAAGIGDQHNVTVGKRTVRRTGRSWWGKRGPDGHVDPLTGLEAREAASALGMPGFDGDQTGTSILVIAPDLSVASDDDGVERTLEQGLTRLVSDLIWCAWPKMIAGRSGRAPITFVARLRSEGGHREIPFPDPGAFPPLECFVRTYQSALKSLQSDRMEDGCTPIKRYSDTIGWLALKSFGVLPRYRLNTGDRDSPDWVDKPSHHVALMRGPRLIVKYLAGPKLPTDVLEYAGVFIPKDHVEAAFALSEPPSHDDWRPETLTESLQKSQVRVALHKITDEIGRFVGRLNSATQGGGELQPLGAFSEQLGSLLTQVEGLGRPDVPKPPPGGGPGGGGGKRKPRASVKQLDEIEYEIVDGRKVAAIPFLVSPLPGTNRTKVRVVSKVGVADGDQSESDPPEGAMVPEVVAWVGPSGNRLAKGESADAASIPAFELGVWKVMVTVPDDALITVELRTE